MRTQNDVIAALATVPGKSAIAMIRASGSGCIGMLGRYFSKALEDRPGHTLHYGCILDEQGALIDNVLVSVYRAPHSYTGEDSVEISTHGSPLVVQDVLGLLYSAGMRPAEAGEFSLRAFMNGKLDLAQAEAVSDIIHASSTAALKAARNQLSGGLSAKVGELRSSLVDTAALLELELDFAEEDIAFVEKDALKLSMQSITGMLNEMIDSYRISRVVREGIHVALVGRPNVGKSSLLNYLLREPRAIVSHLPGTTRDIIREQFEYGGILYVITDTAGLRVSDDLIEQEGVERSRQCIRDSDLILVLGDQDHNPEEALDEVLPLTDKERILCVHNKCDLAQGSSDVLHISALSGEGIEAMLSRMQYMALGTDHYTEKNILALNARHHRCLVDAIAAMQAAGSALDEGMSNEFIALDLRAALDALGEIIGAVTPDEVLHAVFADFCIGK